MNDCDGSGEKIWGPIRRGHATGGWRLVNGPGEYWLEKTLGGIRAIVRADTVSTCFWSTGSPDRPGARTGGLPVDAAITEADAWLEIHTTTPAGPAPRTPAASTDGTLPDHIP